MLNYRALPHRIATLLVELYMARSNRIAVQMAHIKDQLEEASDDDKLQTLNENLNSLQTQYKAACQCVVSITDSPHAEYDPSATLLLSRVYSYAGNNAALLDYDLFHRGSGTHSSSSGGNAAAGATNIGAHGGANVAHAYTFDPVLANPLMLRVAMEANNSRRVLQLLRREGRQDPELYVQALRYFVQRTLRSLAMASNGDLEDGLARRRRDSGSQEADMSVSSDETDSDSDSSSSDDGSSGSDSDSEERNRQSREKRGQKATLRAWRWVIKVLKRVDRDNVAIPPVQLLAILTSTQGVDDAGTDDDESLLLPFGHPGNRGVGVPYCIVSQYISKSINVCEWSCLLCVVCT